MPLDQVDVDKIKDSDQSEMSFFDHLEQLRWHLVRAAISVVVFAILVFLAKGFVFDVIILGPTRSDFATYLLLCSIADFLCINPGEALEIITRDLGEQFITHLKSSIWIGIIISFPYIFWEIWRFIKPGLYENEQNAVRGIVWICSFLFLMGVLFGYFVISPFAVSFLSSYTVSADISNTTTLTSYVNYMTMFTIPTGIIFELPIVIYFLSKVGIVTPQFLRTYRRHAIVIIFVAASIITPPDVVTQFLIATPLIILYEISIFISKRQQKRKD
jgi:sec-independent protein translocase protein TatC